MRPKSEKPNGTRHKSSMIEVQEFCKLNIDDVTACLVLLLDDFKNSLPPSVYSVAALALDRRTIKNRMKSEGLTFATQTLPKLSEGLFQYFETGQVNYPSFKLDKHGVHPVFLSELFALACRTTEHQVTAIRLIYQISVMFSKLKGPYPESVLRKQLADFLRVDRELAELDWFSEVNFPILERARAEVKRLFQGSNILEQAKPRPGPGGTNTPVPKHLRYRPRVLYTQVDNVVPYMDYFTVNPYDVVHQTKSWLELFSKQVQEPTSRHKFVHKKVGKARGICLEENEVQYLQQAFRSAIYDWVERSSIAKGKICFTDQSVNQKLALAGSFTGLLATLDESEASDRIARELVAWIFQDTEFVDHLMALSTRVIEFDKEFDEQPLRTFKFAPMGSALCFPIMAITHWALLRAIISLSDLPTSMCDEIYVYGDDIVVPVTAVDAVLAYLPRFGMKLNTSKSFWRSGFRESCGVHAYNGVDITPVYVKHLPNSPSITFAMSCISVEYQLDKLGFRNVASHIRSKIEGIFGPLPIAPSQTSLFAFKRDGHFFPITTGVVKPERKRDAYGNVVYRFRSVKAVQTMDRPPSEYECYLRHVLTKDMSREMAGNPSRFKTCWRRFTVPELYGFKSTFNEPQVIPHPQLITEEQKYDFYTQGYLCVVDPCLVDDSSASSRNVTEWYVRSFGCVHSPISPSGRRIRVRNRASQVLPDEHFRHSKRIIECSGRMGAYEGRRLEKRRINVLRFSTDRKSVV